ncbi:hypothetical protein [Tsukamurella sp. NPDC003166]|uniref:hypothetical protein n=1 Tax=Tsukamurella sp. NPDC003166 TaxID=3154444 RepID=UPI0033B2B229
MASTANAELSPTNILNVLGAPLQNANQVIKAGVVQTGDLNDDGSPKTTNLPNALFATLVNQGGTGNTAELQKRLKSYLDQSTASFGSLPTKVVGYDVAAISALFAPAAKPLALQTVSAGPAAAPSLGSALDVLGLPLQLATNALQTFNVELRDAKGQLVLDKDKKTTQTNVVNAIFKAVVDFGATGQWGALANNVSLYLAQFGANVASGGFVSQKPKEVVTPSVATVQVQSLTVAAKDTPKSSPADAGLVGDLLNVAGIPLNNVNQAIQSFVVVIGQDKDGNDIKTNVVNAVFKAVVDLGLTGQWGKLADTVTGYVATAAKQVADLPGKVLAYDTTAIGNVFNGGLAPVPAPKTVPSGDALPTSTKSLTLRTASSGSGSEGGLGTGSSPADVAPSEAPTVSQQPPATTGSKGKGVDLFEKFADALGGKGGPASGGGTTGGGTTGGGTTGGGTTGGGTTGGGTTGGGTTGGGTTGGGTTGGGTTGGGTTGGDASNGGTTGGAA